MGKAADHAELNAKKWDSKAETYDEKRFDYFRYMQKRLIALLPLKENLCFLDIGCGTGWAVRYVATLMSQQGEFYGIDISTNMIRKAKGHARDYRNVYFYKANAEELPFQENRFDLIICTNSFHHYLHPSQALNEICRVLKVDGRIYIMDATADGFITKTLNKVKIRSEPEHVKFYSTQEYRLLFTAANLEHVATQLITFPIKVHIGEKHVPSRSAPSWMTAA